MSDSVIREEEFNRHVWNHADDAFQGKFDDCAALDNSELISLQGLLAEENLNSHNELFSALNALLIQQPDIVFLLLQLVGLTRNKILQDVKARVRQSGEKVTGLSNPLSLIRGERGRYLACEYLLAHLQRVFRSEVRPVSSETLQAIRQATWPGYIRQERAKRMGHEAERRLAVLLKECGLPFAPEEKAENPLCRDVDIDGQSYDLISPSISDARLRVLATVHTANIGQYGESKDSLEINQAINTMIEAGVRRDVILLAFVDGVGFESNRKGLREVLAKADEFCQFATIWKAAVIAAYLNQERCFVYLPLEQQDEYRPFCDKYRATLVASDPRTTSTQNTSRNWVDAGDALVTVGN